MTARTRSRIAWTVAVLTLVGLLSSEVMKFVLHQGDKAGIALFVPGAIGLTAMAVVGALIASRTTNLLGWILIAIPTALTISQIGQVYFDHGMPTGARYTTIAYWFSQWPFFASIALLISVFYLFPTGVIASPRWRWPWRVYLASTTVVVVGFALLPYEEHQAGHVVTNPVGVDALGGEPFSTILGIAGLMVVGSAFLAFVSLYFRFRRADVEERQQLRWLFLIAAMGVVLFAIIMVASSVLGDPDTGPGARFLDVMLVLLVADVVIGIPVATGIAIFKYRLYDLNLVVRRTVIVALMAAAITALYVAIVVAVPTLIGRRNDAQGFDVVPLVAAALVALAFDPLRRGARRLADRIVFGERATPYEVLTGFGERVGETYSSDDVMPRMAQVLAQGIGAEQVGVWLRIGSHMRLEANWPPEPRDMPTSLAITGDTLPGFDGAEGFEVRHHGDLLGALTVAMPPNDPMDPAKEKLVGDLAAQAGLVLRNVGLIEELRASRQRLVAAQDEERRKLERDIHDGVQQQLVALTVQLRLAEQLTERDPAKARELMVALQGQTTEALEDLRDLARGIYPPLLADKGLPTALEAQARKSPVPVSVHADGVVRYPQAVESAVYFSCLEALNNVAKYADAEHVSITLAQRNGSLTFDVADDGDGFDPGVTAYGTGLQGIADRLDAVGGSLEIDSEPARGTTLRGILPVGAQR